MSSLYKLKLKTNKRGSFFMKKLKLFALTTVALLGASGVANAETAMLASDDFVGISFWVISMALLASTAFFS